MTDRQATPFHVGERVAQNLAGVDPSIAQLAQGFIRDAMPDQHRIFFENLPFLVVGGVDKNEAPWASILCGYPGFASSPDPKLLNVSAAPIAKDPISQTMRPGAPIGVLGIEPSTRRRNRMNAHISSVHAEGLDLSVDQSFGNCPQYIQTRDFEYVRDPSAPWVGTATALTALDEAAHKTIKTADTLFVASYAHDGVDVSHRGGRRGFVHIDGDTLLIPDFSGNRFFQTLGNFVENPRAGLLFPDFDTGDVLSLTGSVEILWDGDDLTKAFAGAERAWRFVLEHGVRLTDALPLRAKFGKYAPEIANLGSWDDAAKHVDGWRPFRIACTQDESSVIRSFHFTPNDGGPVRGFYPGQFLTLRVTPADGETPIIRTYTVSSAPGDDGYRISVKREDQGRISRHLHDTLSQDDVVEIKAPTGNFHLSESARPVVLIAGGVGITPMISMARHIIHQRSPRKIHIFHSARSTTERAFADDFRALVRSSGGMLKYISFVGAPAPDEDAGTDYDFAGRIDAALLRQTLPLDDYEVYLCGPPPFMQAMYDACQSLGVRDSRIFAEGFGPASVTRTPDPGSAPPPSEAVSTTVTFAASAREVPWSEGDPTLLETAEAAGLKPAFSCRSGSCGTCATRLTAGDVVYRSMPAAMSENGEILICCAVPAKDTDPVELDL